jgi:copper(I)-binding protein
MTSGATGGVMGCDVWVEAMSACLDGELDLYEQIQLDAHLAGCTACRQLADVLEESHRRWRVHTAPVIPDVASSLLASVAQPRRRRRLVGLLAATAGAAAVAAGGVVVVADRGAPPPLLTLGSASVMPASQGEASVVHLRVTNAGGADRVVGATAVVAEHTEFHQTDERSGVTTMHSVTSVPVPAGQAAQFSSDATHLMLVGLRQDLVPGELVTVRLRFARAGDVEIDATVEGPSTSQDSSGTGNSAAARSDG